METKFNFKSQICTTIEQSERLIALGLKKETADMVHCLKETAYIKDWFILPLYHGDRRYTVEKVPAWSLHRLIEMLNIQMQTDGRYIYLADGGFDAHESIYDNIIDCIEWLIKEGYFNKEYLNGND